MGMELFCFRILLTDKERCFGDVRSLGMASCWRFSIEVEAEVKIEIEIEGQTEIEDY